MDILLAIREDGASDRLLVGHNVQMPLCNRPWDTECRQPTHLCGSDHRYLQEVSFVNVVSRVSTIDLGALPFSLLIVTEATAEGTLQQQGEQRFHVNNDLPFGLRVGDYNHDGYPDLLLPLGTEGHIELWENVQCEGSSCPGIDTSSLLSLGPDFDCILKKMDALFVL